MHHRAHRARLTAGCNQPPVMVTGGGMEAALEAAIGRGRRGMGGRRGAADNRSFVCASASPLRPHRHARPPPHRAYPHPPTLVTPPPPTSPNLLRRPHHAPSPFYPALITLPSQRVTTPSHGLLRPSSCCSLLHHRFARASSPPLTITINVGPAAASSGAYTTTPVNLTTAADSAAGATPFSGILSPMRRQERR